MADQRSVNALLSGKVLYFLWLDF